MGQNQNFEYKPLKGYRVELKSLNLNLSSGFGSGSYLIPNKGLFPQFYDYLLVVLPQHLGNRPGPIVTGSVHTQDKTTTPDNLRSETRDGYRETGEYKETRITG